MPKFRPNWMSGSEDTDERDEQGELEFDACSGSDTALDAGSDGTEGPSDDSSERSAEGAAGADPEKEGLQGTIEKLRSERDRLAREVEVLRVTSAKLKYSISELESGHSNIEQAIRTTNEQGQHELAQMKEAGLSSLMSWLEEHIDIAEVSGVGSVPAPRVIEITDLIDHISQTDPDQLYATVSQDGDRINVHFPWLSDNSSVQQTTATLVLAFAAAIAGSRPLASSVSESSQARRLAGLLSELVALERDVSDSSHGAGDAVHYSNLIKFLLIAVNHAEHDSQYVSLNLDELLSGVGSGISEWLDMVAPLYRPIISELDAERSSEYRQKLAQDVVRDWLIGQDAFAHDAGNNGRAANTALLDFLERSSDDRFDAAMFAALNNWTGMMNTFVERGNTTSVGVAMVVDLTYRLGTGTMTADWRIG
jgi:hypothetical protein